MKIKKIHIENFTVFENQDIEFCDGVNVLIGANGTGKSHLLKILYAVTQDITDENGTNDNLYFQFLFLLYGLFKPEDGEYRLLMRNRNRHSSEFRIDFGTDIIPISIPYKYRLSEPPATPYLQNANRIFIPPNDVLAIYPGFTASYEKRELAFDQTYYDLCKALSAAPLKNGNEILSKLGKNLENILNGRVVQKGDRFYVKNKETEQALEAHLLAEGHRKIATLVHLINNGSIDKDTILFWDEPEANMNPRLIKPICEMLRGLAKEGVQVFIATHDYLVTGELSLASEYKTEPQVPIRFLAMSREGDQPVEIQSGDTLADLEDNPILDEFAAHYTREEDAVRNQLKEG